MKNAIANFINKHPFLTFMLADSIIGMVKILFRGYPTSKTTHITTDGEKVKIDKDDLDEVEIVEGDE